MLLRFQVLIQSRDKTGMMAPRTFPGRSGHHDSGRKAPDLPAYDDMKRRYEAGMANGRDEL